MYKRCKRILKWLGAITVLRQGLRQQSFVYDSDAHAANPFTRKDISQTEIGKFQREHGDIAERCKWEAQAVTFPLGKNFDLTKQGAIDKNHDCRRLWLWDTEFCGSIDLRWQPGTSKLPAHVLGHIGYAVVPWKEGRGYTKLALKFMLSRARTEGLEYVEITTDPNNAASRRVIEANGGALTESIQRPAQYGGTDAVRYRITL